MTWQVAGRYPRWPEKSSLESGNASPETLLMGVIEELRALDHVVDRLVEKYPTVPRTQIEDIVEQEHRSLDAGRLRDYVPILVEHAVRNRLRQ